MESDATIQCREVTYMLEYVFIPVKKITAVSSRSEEVQDSQFLSLQLLSSMVGGSIFVPVAHRLNSKSGNELIKLGK